MGERVLPSNVDYTKILPLAVESRSRRRSFFPTNGQQFTSDGNNIIRIDISASAFLDSNMSTGLHKPVVLTSVVVTVLSNDLELNRLGMSCLM